MKVKEASISRRSFAIGAGAAVGAGVAATALGCAPSGGSDKGSEPAGADAQVKSAVSHDDGEWIPSTCNMCFNNCSILAHVVDGTLVEITGNPDSPIGGGRICAKGAAGIMQLYDPNRVTKPLKRTNPNKGFDEDPGWVEISWDEAYDTIVSTLQAASATEGKCVGGASMVAGLNGSVWRSLAIGCVCGASEGLLSDICGAGIHVVEALFTSNGNAMPDYDNTNYVIQFGTQAGTATRHGFTMTCERFAQRRRDGLKLVSFDPHMSAGAEQADIWMALRPGSDAAAALAIANVLVENDFIDREFLVKRTNACALVDPDTGRVLRTSDEAMKSMYWDQKAGEPKAYDEAGDPALEGTFDVDGKRYKTAFEVYKEHIAPMTPEWAADITTLDADALRKIALEFGEAACIGQTTTVDGVELPYRPAAVDIFSGVSRHKHAILSTWSCLMINVLIGGCNSVGGFIGFGPACNGWTDDNPQAGFRATIFEPDGFLNNTSLMLGAPHSFYDTIYNGDYTPQGMGMAALQPLSEDGHFVHVAQSDPDRYHTKPITHLFWYACNPIKWWANADEQAEVYKKMDFIAGCDLFLNDMSLFSDIMIPEATYLERWDVLPQWYMNHRMPGGMTKPWTLAMWQPVVEPKDGVPGFMDIYGELCYRAGEQSNAAFIGALAGMYRIKEEYMPDLTQKLDKEVFIDAVYKSNIDEEHGLDWFKENGGVYTHDRTVDEVYIWANDAPGRIPFYWDFMLEMKDKVEAKVAELDIPWETDDYIPLPEWRPGGDFYPVEDAAFDMFPIYYTNAANTDSWTVENPWLNEVNEDDGVTYCIEMNPATAKAKGIESGDEIVITSTAGYSVEGKVVLNEGIHPECLSSVVGTWDCKSKAMSIAFGKGVNLVSLLPGTKAERMDHIVSAFDQLIRVKIEKK
ncbi:molybdopterin-dependent oxidoreductase [Raoultibacter massiliensis]|uniref:molybdopterin-dependent oxidoreductase n=1 Tax=Raoultibacter massiliensis TaxID=1852371 RepID=UPI000C8397D9|nr:molybdopterin-dependent oxidoreductase [Raoultibacter massiliensis]